MEKYRLFFFWFCLVVYAWIVLTDIYVSSVDLHRWSPEFIHFRSIKPDIIPSFLPGTEEFYRLSRFLHLFVCTSALRTHAREYSPVYMQTEEDTNKQHLDGERRISGMKCARSGWRCGRSLTVSVTDTWRDTIIKLRSDGMSDGPQPSLVHPPRSVFNRGRCVGISKLKEMICFQLFSRRLVIKRPCDRGPDPFRSYLDNNYKPNQGSNFFRLLIFFPKELYFSNHFSHLHLK